MILKYLIPWDRQTISCPLTVAEATQRLRAVTVKRHWVRVLAAVPGTFEGTVADDRFTVLTSAEGYKLFGFARMRNIGRPVCGGRLTALPDGCRVVVNFRLQWVVTVAMTYLFAFGVVFVPLCPPDIWRTNHIDPVLAHMLSIIFVINYIVGTLTFWVMRNQALASLRSVIAGPASIPPPILI
jgi:hypothetical protein